MTDDTNPWAPPADVPAAPQWSPPQPWAPPWPPPQPGGWGPPQPGAWGPAPGWSPYPVPPPRRRGIDRAIGALLLALVVVFVSGVAVAVQRTVSADEVSAADRAQLQAELPALQSFVARERGLQFKQPVDVELLAEGDFLRRFFATDDEETVDDDAPDPDATFYALGWSRRRGQLYQDVDDSLAAGVVGYYDTDTKELLIRGGDINPFTRLVIVHELVHALQDQHFDVDREELDDLDDEQSLAFTALIEGDATRVEEAYREALPPADRTELDRIEQQLFGSAELDGPEALYVLQGFPYAIGGEFVSALHELGGNARVDQAFAAPPTTSEHLLHPEAYIGKQREVTVAAPDVDDPIDHGVLGELGIALLIGGGEADRLDDNATQGWGGDRYATYESGRRVCVAALIAMDTPNDLDELHQALLQLPNRQSLRTTGARSLFFETCR